MKKLLYSLVLELAATSSSILPKTTGHQTHALFLSLMHQVNPTLATKLHDEPTYRPFTVSALFGPTKHGKEDLFVQAGQKCQLRITLLDGSELWQELTQRLQEDPTSTFHIGQATFTLVRTYATPSVHAAGYAGSIDWQTLTSMQARTSITFHFTSPTAFSLGNHQFALFPQPIYIWDSLMRSWNTYAPEVLHIEKEALRTFVTQQINVQDYSLHTETLHFPRHIQRGFVGRCTYHLTTQDETASQVGALAELAPYSGIGYKTTMGMGQVSLETANGLHGTTLLAKGSDAGSLS